jgi:hypothetical protein
MVIEKYRHPAFERLQVRRTAGERQRGAGARSVRTRRPD